MMMLIKHPSLTPHILLCTAAAQVYELDVTFTHRETDVTTLRPQKEITDLHFYTFLELLQFTLWFSSNSVNTNVHRG